jgi:hypothetical protein
MGRPPVRELIATVILGLALCIPAWVQDKPKLAELHTFDDSIVVDGFWEPDNPTKQNELVSTAVHIECFRHGGREGNLVKTEAFCIVATAMAPTGILMADFSFAEASWSDDEIVISDDSPICLINKTFFDLKRKTVTGLDIRKPEAKGFADACKLLPDRQSYYLRDRVDYALFHLPAKK